jgi:hypothetical protein
MTTATAYPVIKFGQANQTAIATPAQYDYLDGNGLVDVYEVQMPGNFQRVKAADFLASFTPEVIAQLDVYEVEQIEPARLPIPGCTGGWVLVQQPDGKWVANMPMSFLEAFDTQEEAIANAKAKNPWLFA